jgi:metal-responsive CopG/Arc/MetJ family transcriptional regulator
MKSRANITIDDNILTEIKLLAIKDKASMSSLIEKALIEYLKKRKEKGKKLN